MNTLETVYKLTDIHSRTRPGQYNECQWGKGITHSASGKGPLCTESWIHVYFTSVHCGADESGSCLLQPSIVCGNVEQKSA